MYTVVGIRFKKAGKIYYFEPNDLSIKVGDNVIVETARGIEFGEVVVGEREVKEEEIVLPLKKVLRIASDEDTEHYNNNKACEIEAYNICLKKSMSMTLI